MPPWDLRLSLSVLPSDQQIATQSRVNFPKTTISSMRSVLSGCGVSMQTRAEKGPAPSSRCVQTLLSERWGGDSHKKNIDRKSSLRLAHWAYKLGIKITMSWMSSVSFCHYSSLWWPHCAWMGCRTSSAQRNPVIGKADKQVVNGEAALTAHMNGSKRCGAAAVSTDRRVTQGVDVSCHRC